MPLKKSSAKWRSFCPGEYELNGCPPSKQPKLPALISYCYRSFLFSLKIYLQMGDTQWVYANAIIRHYKMSLKLCVLTLICHSLNAAIHGGEFKLDTDDTYINCVDISGGHVRSAVDCAFCLSEFRHYNHGFVYRDGRCYVCRADNANCGKSREEVLLKGPHHIKGNFMHACIYIISNTLR